MRKLFPSSIWVLAIGACLALSPAAVAAPPVPEDFSAADQYVESVPTSEGAKPAGTTKGGAGAAPTPVALGGGAGELAKLASSPALGAPQQKLDGGTAKEKGVPSAVVSSVGEGDNGSLLALLIALLVVSGVVAGTASHRHYRNRQSPGDA
jgi:hypothetical protein